MIHVDEIRAVVLSTVKIEFRIWNLELIRAHKTILDISNSMVALSLLIAIVLVYFISLNDDGFAYQRSAEGVVLYVQVKSHTFLPNNTINDLFIVYHRLFIIFLPYAHTILLCFPTPPSYSS